MVVTVVEVAASDANGHSQPEAATTDNGVEDSRQVWMATRLDHVRERYPVSKPKHRDVSEPIAMPSGLLTTFSMGRFLTDIAEYFLAGRNAELGEAGRRLAEGTQWFGPWLARLRKLRGMDPAGESPYPKPPTVNEQVALLVAAFPTEIPRSVDSTLAVVRSNGASYQLVVKNVYRQLAAAFAGKGHVSREQLQAFNALPWSGRWKSMFYRKRHQTWLLKALPTELQVGLLLHNCRKELPEYGRIVPLCGSDIRGVYRWRPGWWLGHIVDNWLAPGENLTGKPCNHPRVKLTRAQMHAIETLTWVEDWLHGVRDRRSTLG